MPYQGYTDGLYLLKQPSTRKLGIDHYGIWDVGNRLQLQGSDWHHPTVIHQMPEGIQIDWFQNTGAWTNLGKVSDEEDALRRIQQAFADPSYRLFDNNCEHFARYVATGVKESTQVQAAGIVVGLAALVYLAND